MPPLLVALGLAASAPGELIWSDEFDAPTLSSERWSVVDDCWGGGNDERQCYTPGNVTLSNGLLRITARRESHRGPALPRRKGGDALVTRAFTSGKLETRGKASFLYGRIEVRAKLPEGQGLWPAIWLLPEHDNYGPYPQSGEIDLAESVNLGVRCRLCLHGERRVFAALHHGWSPESNRQIGGDRPLPSSPDGFHVFALDWTPKKMTWSVDGRRYFSTATRPPFDQRFHLILNLAVGGRWPEGSNAGGVDASKLPAVLLVDWVRVYR